MSPFSKLIAETFEIVTSPSVCLSRRSNSNQLMSDLDAFQIEDVDDIEQRVVLIGQHLSQLDELTVQANASAATVDLTDNRLEYVFCWLLFHASRAVHQQLRHLLDIDYVSIVLINLLLSFGYVFRSGVCFDQFTALKTLILDKNFLDEFPADFPVLQSVETLWINNNAVRDLLAVRLPILILNFHFVVSRSSLTLQH
jgi:hypothetical protein